MNRLCLLNLLAFAWNLVVGSAMTSELDGATSLLLAAANGVAALITFNPRNTQ